MPADQDGQGQHEQALADNLDERLGSPTESGVQQVEPDVTVGGGG